jgi:hypothetical protein
VPVSRNASVEKLFERRESWTPVDTELLLWKVSISVAETYYFTPPLQINIDLSPYSENKSLVLSSCGHEFLKKQRTISFSPFDQTGFADNNI